MSPLSTITPVLYVDRNHLLTGDVPLSKNCILTTLPAFLREKEVAEKVGSKIEAWMKECRLALVVEYDAKSFDEPDPNWKGGKSRKLEEWARELTFFSYFALWLARPTTFTFWAM